MVIRISDSVKGILYLLGGLAVLVAATLLLLDVGGFRTAQEKTALRYGQWLAWNRKNKPAILRNLKRRRPVMLLPTYIIGILLIISGFVELIQ